MSSLFEEVYVHDYDEENLSFRKRFSHSLTLEVIDESDKLLIRSKAGNPENNNSATASHDSQFRFEVYKDTPCSEFTKSGFVVTDENGKSILLRFAKHYIYDNEKANYAETDFCRFSKLVNDFKLGRRESVFTLRTDEASATQYFQFYGYLSQQQNMMQDYIRTSTYQRAILSNMEDFRNKIVLDVGAGSGILSFFAIQAGARKVYAVEASSMAKHAETLVANNKLSDRIIVIPGKIEEINLPEQVDIIISEPMGYMLFNERMLETYLHAKKWLAPNGNMFPTRGDLHIAPFSDAQLYTEQLTKANFWFQQNFHGVDLTSLRDAALKEYFYQPVVDTFDIRICMSKSVKHSVDFLKAHEKDLHTIDIPLKFQVTQTDEIHGLAFWFDVAFFGSQQSVWLSTSPTQPLTHWYQVRCLIDKPLFVQRGHTVSGRVVLVSNSRQSYNVEIELKVDNIPGSHASNSLDLKNPYFRYTGQPIQPPPGCNTTSPSEDYWQQLDSTNLSSQNPMMNGGNMILNGGAAQPNLNGISVGHQQQQIQLDPNQQQQYSNTNGCPIPAAHMNNNQTMLNNVNNSASASPTPLNCSTNRILTQMQQQQQPINNQQQQQQLSLGSSGNGNGLSYSMMGQNPASTAMVGNNNQMTGNVMSNLFANASPSSSTNVAGINNMNFPVNQSLMIGDYAAAVAGQTIPPYKPL